MQLFVNCIRNIENPKYIRRDIKQELQNIINDERDDVQLKNIIIKIIDGSSFSKKLRKEIVAYLDANEIDHSDIAVIRNIKTNDVVNNKKDNIEENNNCLNKDGEQIKDNNDSISDNNKLVIINNGDNSNDNKLIIIDNDDNLEHALDMKCERYVFTKNNPAEYIHYNESKKSYVLKFQNENEKTSKHIDKLMHVLKEKYNEKYKDNIIDTKIHKIYNKKIISYIYNDIELFDIQHVISFCKYNAADRKYNACSKLVTYYSYKNNSFGGFYIKEYIKRSSIVELIGRTNGCLNFMKIIGEPLIYKIPIETETLHTLSTIFQDYNPIFQYCIYKYRVDMYLQSVNICIECDENNHRNRNKEYEMKRESYITDKLKCVFYRYNPDSENFNINTVIRDVMRLCVQRELNKNT